MDLAQEMEKSEMETTALSNLQRNMESILISSMDEEGPEIDFGERGKLTFKPRIPVTAMLELIGNPNKIQGLQNYIRASLRPESREVFDGLLDDIPVEGLNQIIEFLTEAVTSFPSK